MARSAKKRDGAATARSWEELSQQWQEGGGRKKMQGLEVQRTASVLWEGAGKSGGLLCPRRPGRVTSRWGLGWPDPRSCSADAANCRGRTSRRACSLPRERAAASSRPSFPRQPVRCGQRPHISSPGCSDLCRPHPGHSPCPELRGGTGLGPCWSVTLARLGWDPSLKVSDGASGVLSPAAVWGALGSNQANRGDNP